MFWIPFLFQRPTVCLQGENQGNCVAHLTGFLPFREHSPGCPLSIFENNHFIYFILFSCCLQQLGPYYSILAGSESLAPSTFKKNLTILFWNNFIFTKKVVKIESSSIPLNQFLPLLTSSNFMVHLSKQTYISILLLSNVYI